MAHTPGPWRIEYDDLAYSRSNLQTTRVILANSRADEEERDRPYRLFLVPYASELDEANAKLIASAPDLLTALEELTDLVQGMIDGTYTPDSFTLQPARTALAKARGE